MDRKAVCKEHSNGYFYDPTTECHICRVIDGCLLSLTESQTHLISLERKLADAENTIHTLQEERCRLRHLLRQAGGCRFHWPDHFTKIVDKELNDER